MMIWKPPLPRPPQGSRRPSAPRREHPTLFHFTFQRTTLPNSATRSTESIYKEPPPNVKIEKGFFQSKSLALFPAPGIEHHRRPVQGVMPAAEVYPSRPEAIAHYQHPINSYCRTQTSVRPSPRRRKRASVPPPAARHNNTELLCRLWPPLFRSAFRGHHRYRYSLRPFYHLQWKTAGSQPSGNVVVSLAILRFIDPYLRRKNA